MENPKPNPKFFFLQSQVHELLIHRGFERLFCFRSWQGMALQTFQIFSAKIQPTGLKGFSKLIKSSIYSRFSKIHLNIFAVRYFLLTMLQVLKLSDTRDW